MGMTTPALAILVWSLLPGCPPGDVASPAAEPSPAEAPPSEPRSSDAERGTELTPSPDDEVGRLPDGRSFIRARLREQVVSGPLEWYLPVGSVGRSTKVPEGLVLYGVRSKSLKSLLGFQNGDIVVAVNGVPVADPQRLHDLEALGRTATSFHVELQRQGRAVTLTIAVVP